MEFLATAWAPLKNQRHPISSHNGLRYCLSKRICYLCDPNFFAEILGLFLTSKCPVLLFVHRKENQRVGNILSSRLTSFHFFIAQYLYRCGLCKKKAQKYTITTSNNSHPIPLLARSNGQCQIIKANHIDDTLI